jgi:phosphatidylglycerophosphatase A
MEDNLPSVLKPRRVGAPTPADLGRVDRAMVAVATLFGLGRVRVVGGSLGALAAALVWVPASFLPLPVYGAALALITALGIAAAGHFDRIHGTKDDPRIVIDEFAGVLLAMIPGARTLSSLLAGLVLFGVLDVLKPPPIRQIEKHVPGGLGVMGDDLAAGLFAGVLLWVMRWTGLV